MTRQFGNIIPKPKITMPSKVKHMDLIEVLTLQKTLPTCYSAGPTGVQLQLQ